MSTNITTVSTIRTPTECYIANKGTKLGSGSYGTVFPGKKLNSDLELKNNLRKKRIKPTPFDDDSPVAIKVFSRQKSYLQEISFSQMATENKVPHAIRYRDSLMKNQTKNYQMMMDYIPGKTLDKVAPSLSWPDIITITKQLFEFSQGLDKLNIVHADLKPSNMIFEKDARYLTVLDFGLALKSAKRALNFDGPFEIIQTVDYRAPEIMLELGPTTSADIWSVGCIIYQIVTTEYFFQTTNDYWGDVKDPEPRRRQCLRELSRRIGLPSLDYVNKIKDKECCPWKIQDNKVCWTTSTILKPPLAWQEKFREKANAINASKEEIDCLLSMLQKIFRYENRASIEELIGDFEKSIQKDVCIHVDGMDRFHKLTIVSDDMETTIDNALRVYRTCIHVPKSSNDTYFMTLADKDIVILDKHPLKQTQRLFNLSIAELINSAKLPPVVEKIQPTVEPSPVIEKPRPPIEPNMEIMQSLSGSKGKEESLVDDLPIFDNDLS